jgi:hypothetical protein
MSAIASQPVHVQSIKTSTLLHVMSCDIHMTLTCNQLQFALPHSSFNVDTWDVFLYLEREMVCFKLIPTGLRNLQVGL